LNLWIVIGNFLTSPHKEWLPTTTAMCDVTNSTCSDDVTTTMTSPTSDLAPSFVQA